jgi:ubiquitin conjugation factor E4 B
MADEATWAQQPSRTRQQRAQQHQQDEGTARYFMQFTNEVLHMLCYLSEDSSVALIFMLPELADRISQMLNHFLAQLLGPKTSNLKVTDPDRY